MKPKDEIKPFSTRVRRNESLTALLRPLTKTRKKSLTFVLYKFPRSLFAYNIIL